MPTKETDERPILFSAPMIRALLNGSKTQTRRVFKSERMTWDANGRYTTHAMRGGELLETGSGPFNPSSWLHYCPFGQPGDQLWVREAWTTHACFDKIPPRDLTTRSIHYQADGKIETGKHRAGFHMPRWASRILLEVTTVRVERLQDISEADAMAEGCKAGDFEYYHNAEGTESAKESYECLWGHINGPDSWITNPWVWVLQFKVVKP